MAAPKRSARSVKHVPTSEFLTRLRKAKELLARLPDPIAALQQAKLTSPLILFGEDQIRIQRYLAWLSEHIFPAANRAAVIKHFAPELTNASRLRSFFESLRTTSLFSQFELVIIRDADTLKGNNGKAVVEALKSVPSNRFVVLTGGESMPQGSLIAGVESQTTVEVTALSESELKTWVERELKQNGHQAGISSDALQLIIQSLGNDIGQLTQFLEKLTLLIEPAAKIEISLVSQILVERPEKTSFELLRAIARRDSLSTAECLDSLLRSGMHPLQITAFLSRAYRTLLFKSDNPNGASHADFENPWYWRQLSGNSALFRGADLRRGIDTIAALDRELKGSKLAPELVASLMIQHLVFRNTPSA